MFKGTVCCFNIDISCSKVEFAVLKSTFCCFNVNISCSKVEFAVLTSTFHVQRYSLLF